MKNDKLEMGDGLSPDRALARAEEIAPFVSQDFMATFARAGMRDVATEVARRECAACKSRRGCEDALQPNGYWGDSVIAVVAGISMALDEGVIPSSCVGHLVFMWFLTLNERHLDLTSPLSPVGMDDLGAVFAGICISELTHLGYTVVEDDEGEMLVLPKAVA